MTSPIPSILTPPTQNFDNRVRNPNKHIQFNDTVTIKAIAADRIKTFHITLDEKIHTVNDKTLFFHINLLENKKVKDNNITAQTRTNIYLQYPSDPPLEVDPAIGKVYRVPPIEKDDYYPKDPPGSIRMEMIVPMVIGRVTERNELSHYLKTGTFPYSYKKIPLPEQLYTSYCSLKKQRTTDFVNYNLKFLQEIDATLNIYEKHLKAFGFKDPNSETALTDTILETHQLEESRFFYFIPETYWTLPNLLDRKNACIALQSNRFWSSSSQSDLSTLISNYEWALAQRGCDNDVFTTQLIEIGKNNSDCDFLLHTNLKELSFEELEERQAYFANAINTYPELEPVLDLIERLILQSLRPSEPAHGAAVVSSAESSEPQSFPPPPASQ